MQQTTFDWTARTQATVTVERPPQIQARPLLPQLPITHVFFRPVTRSRPRLVDGEYQRVAQWSSRKDLLEKAHSTPCTMVQAKALLDILSKENGVRVHIRWRSGMGRGRAYCQSGMISLPTRVLQRGEQGRACKLRVGLVLHEPAHIVAGPRHAHDRHYVRTLDRILVQADGLY